MEGSKVFLFSQHYCSRNKSITFFLEVENANELLPLSPIALHSDAKLYPALSHEERERVSYLAGYQLAQEMVKKLDQVKNKLEKTSKATRKKPQTKKRSIKKL